MDFGKLPLGNAFLKPDDFASERRYRLQLAFCPRCFLVQQTHPPPKGALQSDYTNYAYVPFGETLDRHYSRLARSLSRDLGLTPKSFVLDIGSNNGLLLGKIKVLADCRVFGVEPAVKISEMARQRGVPTMTGFYTRETARRVRHEQGPADAVIMTQVLQHIPNLRQLMEAVAESLSEEGVMAVEGRYFADTMKKRSYDTVYHEMLWFFTLHSLWKLFKSVGLTIFHAEKSDIYGGSLRIYARKGRVVRDESVERILEEEAGHGIRKLGSYGSFATDVFQLREQLRKVVAEVKSQGKSIAGYGAPSTSATLLNFCGIGNRDISYVVDDSKLKQGLYTPGTHIRITDFSTLDVNPPDYILLLAWRLKDEIFGKVEGLRRRGTRTILPLPTVRIV